MPVATRAEFVGRRREIQRVLRVFREDGKGVLIHGMGALGKSSLAARVLSRLPHLKPVVIFERYDALAIFDEVLAALAPKLHATEKAQWREAVHADASQLCGALQSWLADPLDVQPMLLIVDDLERILEAPKQSDAPTGVSPGYREALAAVLLAFDRAATQSRLLLTSRYDFSLPDGAGGDLARTLRRVPLRPMAPRERQKQWRAAERVAGRETAELDATANALLARALHAAAGNPGLQAILTRPILGRELAAAAEALGRIEFYLAEGKPPKEIEALVASGKAKDSGNALTAFFGRLSFAAYRDALTPDQARQLAAATHFSAEVPIPLPALAAAGQALGVEAPEAAISRLVGLGLVDDWGLLNAVLHAAANPLARPLAPPIDPADFPRVARKAMPMLIAAWRREDGLFPVDPRGAEAARFALAAGAEPAILEDAALSGAAWLERGEGRTRDALDLIAPSFAAFPEAHAIGPEFLRLGVECADRLGEAILLDALPAAPVRAPEWPDPEFERRSAHLELRRAERMIRVGRVADAEAISRKIYEKFAAVDLDPTAAFAAGQIADILQARGDLDEALRIRREDELPVYDRLGDVRSRAVAIGKIADILFGRGDLDEALRILQEELLPIFGRLCDVRSRAVTMGRIADILETRGDLDEALRIRQEEQLPVYDRLGDVRERALAMGQIAGIFQARGDLDEALRIRQEEQLPVYDRLGDVRSRALAMGKIADILFRRGDLDEAMRIRQEEELPVYERLGDVRSRAVTMGKIADILFLRGDLDEALRIRREEELPVYERLGDVRSRAVTMGQIADILQARGDLDEALRIRREEQLPVYNRVGDVRGRAVALSKIASALLAADGIAKGLIQEIYESLAESYAIALKLGLPEGVAYVGAQLAHVMALRGLRDEALAVLDHAERAFQKLGQAEGVAQVRQLREQIAQLPPPSRQETSP